LFCTAARKIKQFEGRLQVLLLKAGNNCFIDKIFFVISSVMTASFNNSLDAREKLKSMDWSRTLASVFILTENKASED